MSWSQFRSKATAWFKREKVVLKQTAFDLIRFWGLFHVTTTYGVNITLCIGPSMIPTFKEKGDVVLIDNFSYKVRSEKYKTGDVVISVCPYDAEKTVCKRIAGTAGDIVVVNRNQGSYSEPILIPPGHVWLAGDNSWNSTDSRTYGPVPVAMLRGRVFWKLKLDLSLGEPVSRVAPPPPPPPQRNAKPTKQITSGNNDKKSPEKEKTGESEKATSGNGEERQNANVSVAKEAISNRPAPDTFVPRIFVLSPDNNPSTSNTNSNGIGSGNGNSSDSSSGGSGSSGSEASVTVKAPPAPPSKSA